jgi:DNA modification methylase
MKTNSKPYYQDDLVTLYHGDSREIVPTLGRFDLLLTDPPYGLGKKMHDGGTWSTNEIYDDMLEWDAKDLPTTEDILSFSKHCSASIVWGGNYFQLPASRCRLIWRKQNKIPSMADFELAWTNVDANSREYTGLVNQDGKRYHPTQKPLNLMLWCINQAKVKWQIELKTILDCFAGSGTTGRAAKDMGIKSVLIEREEKYCKQIVKRMQQESFNLGV